MGNYLIKRLVKGILSIIAVVAIVMVLVYTLMDRNLIFVSDAVYSKMNNNNKTVYKYQKWEEYGYLDYVPYADYLTELYEQGEITAEEKIAYANIGKTADKDSAEVAKYVEKFTEYYQSKGYTVERLDAFIVGKKVAEGGQQKLFAYQNIPLAKRLFNYFANFITIDNIHNAENIVGERGLTFTWYDPLYGGEKFSPALIGNGTTNKYLIYFNNQFPYIHQNVIKIRLGTSYAVNKGIDVFDTMMLSQGSYVKSTVLYPTGLVESSADDLHTAQYIEGSLEISEILQERFVDDYTSTVTVKSGFSRTGYSFIIGIISTIISYLLGVPLGILMAKKKDTFVDKLGTIYVVFIIAVPSLAYIFLFKAIGGEIGLKTTFDMESPTWLMYVLPIISLSLPSIASLMKWLRRYMIDEMNSDYVKFARSGGLTESEIFNKHILKNALIPIVHGIPGSIIGSLTGAIITESVYVVPGAGNLLTNAISHYDNGVIVGMTLYFATLSVISIILGDIMMSLVDPRISYTAKDR